jgi:hypothetical protein
MDKPMDKPMNETFTISDLQERYSLSARQSVYDRIKALGIVQISRGKLSGEQLDKLDKLHEWLKANPNKPIADFPQFVEVMVDKYTIRPDNSTSALSTDSVDKQDNFAEMLGLVEAIARHFVPKVDPLAHYAALERAIEHGWLLSSNEVAELIGIRPKGDRFERGSFAFDRKGKIGGQSGWKVSKLGTSDAGN